MNGESSITTLARDRPRQPQHLEQVRAGGAEERHAARPACVELLLEVGADLCEVALELFLLRVIETVLAERAFSGAEQRLELHRAIAGRRELARVEIQVEAQDLVAFRPEPRQLPEPLFDDHDQEPTPPGSGLKRKMCGWSGPADGNRDHARIPELIGIGRLPPDPGTEPVPDQPPGGFEAVAEAPAAVAVAAGSRERSPLSSIEGLKVDQLASVRNRSTVQMASEPNRLAVAKKTPARGDRCPRRDADDCGLYGRLDQRGAVVTDPDRPRRAGTRACA